MATSGCYSSRPEDKSVIFILLRIHCYLGITKKLTGIKNQMKEKVASSCGMTENSDTVIFMLLFLMYLSKERFMLVHLNNTETNKDLSFSYTISPSFYHSMQFKKQ